MKLLPEIMSVQSRQVGFSRSHRKANHRDDHKTLGKLRVQHVVKTEVTCKEKLLHYGREVCALLSASRMSMRARVRTKPESSKPNERGASKREERTGKPWCPGRPGYGTAGGRGAGRSGDGDGRPVDRT